jgi:hypothetical protein
MSRLAESALGDKPFVLQSPSRPVYPDGVPLDICALFERFTLEAVNSGLKRYSADAVLHRIRWYCQVERRSGEFKCNNNWTAPLARWFMATYPRHAGFFETRERKPIGYVETSGD